MQKESLLFFSFLRQSNFGEAKINKIICKTNRSIQLLIIFNRPIANIMCQTTINMENTETQSFLLIIIYVSQYLCVYICFQQKI